MQRRVSTPIARVFQFWALAEKQRDHVPRAAGARAVQGCAPAAVRAVETRSIGDQLLDCEEQFLFSFLGRRR